MLALRDVIADALRGAAPRAQWQSGGVDRAIECADLFINAGVRDLLKLGVVSVDVYEALAARGISYATKAAIDDFNAREGWRACRWERMQVTSGGMLCRHVSRANPGPIDPVALLSSFQSTPFAFSYEGRQIGFLGDANNDGSITNAAPFFQIHEAGPLIAWSARGDGGCAYVLSASETGFSVIPIWGKHGDAGFWKQTLAMGVTVIGTGLALGGVNLSAQVGRAIIGPQAAAAYPTLAASVGNTALATAVNGGDVGAAVAGTLSGLGGAIAGSYAAGLTDSALVGTLARAATSAAMAGGDIEAAVQRAALNFAANEAIERGSQIIKESTNMEFATDVASFDFEPLAPAGGIEFEAGSFGPVTQVSTGGIQSFAPFDLSFDYGGSLPSYGFDVDLPFGGGGFQTPPLNPAPVPGGSGSSGWDFAIAALRMLPQFVNRSVPMPQPAPPRSVSSGGAVNPATLPVRSPVVGPDGRVYTNLGDGTYSVIDSGGRTAILPMPGRATGGAGGVASALSSPWVLGALGLGAVLLLARRS